MAVYHESDEQDQQSFTPTPEDESWWAGQNERWDGEPDPDFSLEDPDDPRWDEIWTTTEAQDRVEKGVIL